jgi:hypothetical protein
MRLHFGHGGVIGPLAVLMTGAMTFRDFCTTAFERAIKARLLEIRC